MASPIGRDALLWKLEGVSETHRHAGHADILRDRIEQAAREAGGIPD